MLQLFGCLRALSLATLWLLMLFVIFSHLKLCLCLPLTETFFFFLLPLPAHCVVQPRGKSSQARPGHHKSGPRHRYLSWTLEQRDDDGTKLCLTRSLISVHLIFKKIIWSQSVMFYLSKTIYNHFLALYD